MSSTFNLTFLFIELWKFMFYLYLNEFTNKNRDFINSDEMCLNLKKNVCLVNHKKKSWVIIYGWLIGTPIHSGPP
jgi:hypothetical protein